MRKRIRHRRMSTGDNYLVVGRNPVFDTPPGQVFNVHPDARAVLAPDIGRLEARHDIIVAPDVEEDQ